MGTTLLAFIVISVPGLLSATCSSPSFSEPAPNSGYAVDNRFYPRRDASVQESPTERVGQQTGWAEDYAASRRSSPRLEQQQQQQQQPEEHCENGWCGEDGSCSCNPCWSGPTCQEYVDRFSPRFLAEEPFFIVDGSTVVTTLPFPSLASSSSSLDSSEGGSPSRLNVVLQAEASSRFSTSPSSVPAASSRLSNHQDEKSRGSSHADAFASSSSSGSFAPSQAALAKSPAAATFVDSNSSGEAWKDSGSTVDLPGSGGTPSARSFPLFRIEAADDDLGLTCQLGQVGPAATCPCATPRYKVIGASTTIPDDRSLASTTNHPEETDNNRPFQESSFYNSFPHRNLSLVSPASTFNQYHAGTIEQTSSPGRETSQHNCPNGWTTTTCQKLNSIMFFADEETGDVFLQNGYNLRPETHYFITLQVSALPVNGSGYKPWREQIVATLFVKSSPRSGAEVADDSSELTDQIPEDGGKMANNQGSGSSEAGDSQEAGDVADGDDAEDAESSNEESGKYDEDDESASAKESKGGRGDGREESTSERSSQLFNYHPLDYSEDTESRAGNNRNNNNSSRGSSSSSVSQQELSSDEKEDSWENFERQQLDNDNEGTVSYAPSFPKASNPGVEAQRRTGAGRRMQQAKNKLPYALRADRPHFKYPASSAVLDFPGSDEDSAYEALLPNEGYTSKRKKREVPDKSQFKMFITRIDSDGAINTTAIPLGAVTKLRLQIQLSSLSKPKDFSLEIRSVRVKETNIKFVILSAYVISIGSDISFDKGSTNLAPVMMPWRNSTVYESVIWKWKDVKCEMREESAAPASFPPQQHMNAATNRNRQRRDDEIVIEFEAVAINGEDAGSVANRWSSSSTTPATPWQQHQSSNKFSSLLRRGEVHNDDVRPSSIPSSITTRALRKSAKQFNVILVPVSAHITFPSEQGRGAYHPHDTQQDRLGVQAAPFAEEEVITIKKEVDKTLESAGTARGTTVDNVTKGDDDEEQDYYDDDKRRDRGTMTLSTQILLPVKYSLGFNTAGERLTNQSYNAFSTGPGKLAASGNGPSKELRNNAATGADVLLEGPVEIPQGGWVSYGIKVYLNHTSRFQLRLEPLQGNEIQYQDTVSVGDIRVVDIGRDFSSCTKIPKKRGFRVTCRKLNGRKGDYCTVESPLMRYCPSEESSKDGVAVDEMNSSGTGEVSSNQEKTESEEKWDVVRKERRRSDQQREEQENTGVQFEGVIYGFPGSAPGSQFVLRACVHVENIEESSVVSGGVGAAPSPDSSVDAQLGRSMFSPTYKEKTLSGKIVHRKQKIRSKGAPQSLDVSSGDFSDGKIPVMREFPAYHYRKRRSVFADHISKIKRRMVSPSAKGQQWTTDDTSKSSTYSVSSSNNHNLFSSPRHSSDNITGQGKLGAAKQIQSHTNFEPTSTNPNHNLASTPTHINPHGAPLDALSSSPPSRNKLHRFQSWENFVNVTSKLDATLKNGNRLRKSKRSSNWLKPL